MNDPQLVTRKVMETPWSFYCAAGWAPECSLPETLDDVPRYPLATLEGRPADMLRSAIPGENIRYVSNSMNALVDVIRTGECIGALPMPVAEQQTDLKRCFVLDVDAGGCGSYSAKGIDTPPICERLSTICLRSSKAGDED